MSQMDNDNAEGQASMASPNVDRPIDSPPGLEHLSQVNEPTDPAPEFENSPQEQGDTTARDTDQPKIPLPCSFDNLFLIVAQHEAIIRKRWYQKSKSKRKALLLEAWPSMAPTRRADLDLWRSEHFKTTPIEEGKVDEILEPFLWPYINLEDMCKLEPLLMMLNSRARFSPDNFTLKDLRSIAFGTRTALIPQTNLPGFYMIFRQRLSPESYGQLYSLHDDGEINSEPSRFWYTPGDGLCVLHVQNRIYEFLYRCCSLILHDMPREVLLPAPDADVEFNLQPLDISTKINPEGVLTLSTEAFEDLYKEPDQANFDRLVTLTQAKLASAEDHLLAMREDPGYFVASMKDRHEHNLYRLLDTDGNADYTSLCGQADVFSSATVRIHIVEAIGHIILLNVLSKKITRLHEAIDPDNTNYAPEMDQPPKLTEVLFDTFYTLNRTLRTLLAVNRLGLAIYSSPPIRGQFRRTHEGYLGNITGNEGLCLPVVPWFDPESADAQHRLVLLLSMLANSELVHLMGPRGLATEIDLLIKRDPELKHLITPWLAEQVSTICVLLECIHQIELFQPWMHGYEMHYAQHEAEYEEKWNKDVINYYNISNVREDFWYELSPLLDDFKDEAFEYPAQKPHCKEVVEAKRKSEATLDLLWNTVVSTLKDQDALPPRVRYIFSLKLQRTPEWVEPPPKATKKKKKKGKKLEDEFDQLMLEARKVNEETLKKQQEEKTEEEESLVGIFEVDKRTLKVMKVLLFDGPDASQLGEVSWNDFVYAMKEMGFERTKLFSFAWLFEPEVESDRAGEGVIFMEPHTTGKLTYLQAKHYGLCLRRIYDWKLEMFKLEA
ncbi:hypothetical protein F5Y06DRAFT_307007 [Hypoxylon sp. FL0890]|nr:hypothetical protein F5Y06DRAFT_307007 [Hypoxylon sp. FL0890]